MNMPASSGQSAFSSRPFAVVCAAWLVASLVVPALPVWDHFFLMAIIFSVGLTGGLWLAVALWAGIPAAAMLLALKRLSNRHYWAATGWLAVPAAALLVYFFGSDLDDIARFRWNKPTYDQVVADARMGRCSDEDRRRWNVAIDAIHCHDPVLVVFVWGGFLSSWHGVVYDAEGEIGKPPSARSTAWKEREYGGLLSCSGTKIALGGHYYLAGGTYTSGAHDCD